MAVTRAEWELFLCSRVHSVSTILFLKAALIGLSIAAPVGPIGLLCIQRTLAHGARIGFLSGLGAASADAVFGAVGAFGLSAITQVFVSLATPLALCGALFLGWMGMKLLRAPPVSRAASAPDTVAPGRAFISVFALTLTNPMTILSFVAVFAAIGGQLNPEAGASVVMVLGVFAGSALWWLGLALAVAALRHRISARAMKFINKAAGTFLCLLAVWQCLLALR